jgi:hypothetical protein
MITDRPYLFSNARGDAHDNARRLADTLNAADPDHAYRATVYANAMWFIRVTDKADEFVGYGAPDE